MLRRFSPEHELRVFGISDKPADGTCLLSAGRFRNECRGDCRGVRFPADELLHPGLPPPLRLHSSAIPDRIPFPERGAGGKHAQFERNIVSCRGDDFRPSIRSTAKALMLSGATGLIPGMGKLHRRNGTAAAMIFLFRASFLRIASRREPRNVGGFPAGAGWTRQKTAAFPVRPENAAVQFFRRDAGKRVRVPADRRHAGRHGSNRP